MPPYLRRDRAAQIARSIAEGGVLHCHETTVSDGDSEMVAIASSQVCAGSLIAMEHAGVLNQTGRIAERLGMYQADRLDMDAPVHRSLYAFVQHHGEGEEEREPCSVVEMGCEAPAGYMVNGLVIAPEEQGETHGCPVCGNPVCGSCSNAEGLCPGCAE